MEQTMNAERFELDIDLLDQEIICDQDEHATVLSEWFRRIVYDWFVRYNPLYFFSALCVLFGTFLVSQGLEGVEWLQGQILLSRVIHAYDFLLIAGAAILFRGAKQYRPAVILGLMEVVFLFDCTFRTEVAATLDQVSATPGTEGRMLAVVWVALLGVKLLMLAWAFRLKVPATVFIVPMLAAIGIAWTSQELAINGNTKNTLHLLATWYGIGLIAYVYWKRPEIAYHLPLDGWGRTVLRRASKAIWFIWMGFYLFHLLIWLKLYDIPLTLSHLASLLLLIPLLTTQEQWIWTGSVNVIALALFNPPTVSLAALAAALVLGWQAWHTQQKRLYVGAVLASYIAVWTIGWQDWPLPEFNLWLSLVTAVILIFMAWGFQLRSALLPLIAGVYPIAKGLHSLSMLGKGIVLLAIGFIALVIGVAINWNQRSRNSVISEQ